MVLVGLIKGPTVVAELCFLPFMLNSRPFPSKTG